jgi:hypothetical protein
MACSLPLPVARKAYAPRQPPRTCRPLQVMSLKSAEAAEAFTGQRPASCPFMAASPLLAWTLASGGTSPQPPPLRSRLLWCIAEQLIELHRGQGLDIFWRDSVKCPSEDDYKRMVLQSRWWSGAASAVQSKANSASHNARFSPLRCSSETGGLFQLAMRLMQIFSSDKRHVWRGVIWGVGGGQRRMESRLQTPPGPSVGLLRSAVGRNFTPLVRTFSLYFQIRDDYANLQSDEARPWPCPRGGFRPPRLRLPSLYSTRSMCTVGLSTCTRARLCLQYTANKSFCEDITEGKFSFPIIHSILTSGPAILGCRYATQDTLIAPACLHVGGGGRYRRPADHQLLNILKQRPTDMDLKRHCLGCMERTGSFEYTVQARLACPTGLPPGKPVHVAQRGVLRELELVARQQIAELGGNPALVRACTCPACKLLPPPLSVGGVRPNQCCVALAC